MTQSQRILIVSDGTDWKRLRGPLEQRGFTVAVARNSDRGFAELAGSSFDLVAVDLATEPNAIQFIRRVRSTPQFTDILILIVAEWGTGEPTLALSAGADACEPTPIDPSRLITSIERLLRPKLAAAANLETL
jgi:DNA-binding response OmpR family regulator